MTRRIGYKILRSSVIYLVLLVVFAAAGYMWGHTRIWYGTEWNYRFLVWVEENAPFIGILGFLCGEILIFGWFIYRMGSYFGKLEDAMEQIVSEGNNWITLPDDMAETAVRLNQIKSQLNVSRMQAREAEQRKNDLVVYLAHDLKTPLTSVMGYLSLLEETEELPYAQRQKYLGIASKKAMRLEELINEFFEITRFNLTHMELEKRQINFTHLLEQTSFEFEPQFAEKGLTCRLEGDREVWVVCDLDKIQRVVDNLLRNACSYAYEGTEIVLRVFKTSEETLYFTCTNKGPTIPEEKLQRVFEQFYRLDSARTSNQGGAGLGLAIARQIVKQHGGAIKAESADGVTCFTVELPVK
ncbi:MAG: HAMP domain-containing histidine kinase [Roseburia sp.]|nr:HAMP domain-containing histidine kinase [Roseburia sp.]